MLVIATKFLLPCWLIGSNLVLQFDSMLTNAEFYYCNLENSTGVSSLNQGKNRTINLKIVVQNLDKCEKSDPWQVMEENTHIIP